MKNITVSPDESLIEATRVRTQQRMERYEEVMQGLRGKLVVGGKLSRESMNER
jgi:hypothetical protein